MGYFSGLGKTVFVMAQGILGAFGVRIPVSFFMSRLPNVRLFYIGLATPCSTVVQVILCLACSGLMVKGFSHKTCLPCSKQSLQFS